MGSYLDIANGGLLFLLCGIAVLFVAGQAFLFMQKAWKQGLALGMKKETMKKVIQNSVVFSIVPSLPIVIILATLMPNLGRYFPWLRLSVVGSGTYEQMAANATAQAFGLAGVADAGFTKEIFVAAMWVMTIGIIWGPLYTALGSKYIQKGIGMIKGKNEKQFNAIFATLFIALLAVFAGPYLAAPIKLLTGETAAVGPRALIPFLSFLVGMALIWGVDVLAKKTKSKMLSEFSFAISLIGGMGSAILFGQLLK